MPKQVFTSPFLSIKIREYDPKNPEFNREVQGSMTPRDSDSDDDLRIIEEARELKLARILARKEQVPSDSDDREVQKRLISHHRKQRLEKWKKKCSTTSSGSDNRAKEDDKKSCRSVTTSSTRCGSSKFSDNDNDRSTEFSQESEEEKQAEQASSSQQNTEQKPTQQSAPSGVPSNPNANQLNLEQTRRIMMSL